MRVLIQRVLEAKVDVAGEPVSRIGPGLLLLTAIGQEDSEAIIRRMAGKVAELRIFNDEQGKFNRSLLDVGGQVMVVSQFTLYANAVKGRRPSFIQAARPETAVPLLAAFVDELRRQGVTEVAEGRFGASMQVTLTNDGPVTIWLDSQELFSGTG